MRRMLVLGVCFLLVACSSGDGDGSGSDLGTSGERDGKVREPPPPPGIRIVREKTVDVEVEVDTYIQCWNQEVWTEEYRIIRPEDIPLTRVKPGSNIRISFSSGQELDG
jgi:hypothetical protein